jgi:hypothetical protein
MIRFADPLSQDDGSYEYRGPQGRSAEGSWNEILAEQEQDGGCFLILFLIQRCVCRLRPAGTKVSLSPAPTFSGSCGVRG